MSCDWDVRCVDCGCDAGFGSTNHAVKDMRAFASRGLLLQNLAKAWLEFEDSLKDSQVWSGFDGFISLRDVSYGWRLSPKWWAQHGGHHLVAVDEYGRCDDECAEHFACVGCKHGMWCRLPKGHAGDQHSEKRLSNEDYVLASQKKAGEGRL